MTTTWVEAKSADGPALAAWLRQRGIDGDAVRRWAKGERAGFHSIDLLLVRNGLHPSVLPDDVWLAEAAVKRHREFCKRGHRMAGANLYVDPKGRHVCRACERSRRGKRVRS